jgi:hypothetical protein
MKNDAAKYDNSELSTFARLLEARCSLLFLFISDTYGTAYSRAKASPKMPK